MEFFFQYLKTKIKTILIALLFAGCLLTTTYLYRVPMEVAVYPIILCVAIGIVMMIPAYFHMKETHMELKKIEACTAELIGEFPKAANIVETDYQKILLSLARENIDIRGEAERAYADMIDYYTVWAHQIKTPIASMKLSLDQEDSPLARKLQGDLMRTGQYVDMVLAFLRLDSDYSDYMIREYSLDDIVRACIRKFAPEFISRKLALQLDPLNRMVITDEKWLSFVIEQILSNALKYTKEGGIHIYMQEDRLCMEDSGIGISSYDLPRVFEKGYTGFNGRKDKEASGLGLYLCHRACSNLNHRIIITSEEGIGTKVMIDFANRI